MYVLTVLVDVVVVCCSIHYRLPFPWFVQGNRLGIDCGCRLFVDVAFVFCRLLTVNLPPLPCTTKTFGQKAFGQRFFVPSHDLVAHSPRRKLQRLEPCLLAKKQCNLAL